jgi:ATP-binding cassette subfamily C (CFTR/MRP) protein 4
VVPQPASLPAKDFSIRKSIPSQMSGIKEKILLFVRNAEAHKTVQKMCDAGFWSKWTYSFVNPLLQLGIKQELKDTDFAAVEESDMASKISKDILLEWSKAAKAGQPSLWRVLLSIFGPRYSLSSIVCIIKAAVLMSQGWFLANLLDWIASPVGNAGYWYAFGIVIDSFLYLFLHHIEWFITFRTGMQIRVGLISAVYQKMLSLSTANTSSTGYITNLVSNDVQRFEDLSPFLNYFLLTPFQIVGYMILMYEQIGYASFTALGTMILLGMIQSSFSPLFKKFRSSTVSNRDERMKSISDMIAGILVVKLYAWETPFMDKIKKLRDTELKFIKNGVIFKSINVSILYTSPIIINLTTFISYHLGGGTLTPSKVFSTMIYMNVLRYSSIL